MSHVKLSKRNAFDGVLSFSGESGLKNMVADKKPTDRVELKLNTYNRGLSGCSHGKVGGFLFFT